MRDDRSDYQLVAKSQTKAVLAGQKGAGATGDILTSVIIVPETSAAGTVTLYDSASGTAMILFNGGGVTALQDLKPHTVSFGSGIRSVAGSFQISTGDNVHVIAVGRFT